MKKRLDLLLVDLGLAKSRAQAQELISNNLVLVGDKIATKPSAEIPLSQQSTVLVLQNQFTRYASRGGLKLEGALRHLNYSVKGLTVLDIGMSTGGFTDCLLQSGARRVVGVDVGHSQLDSKLASDARVTSLEGVNARNLTPATLAPHMPDSGFDLIVVDVSFISLEKVLPQLRSLLSPSGALIALVKPQFELNRSALSKRGVVLDPKHFDDVKKKICQICDSIGILTEAYFESSLPGTDGNQEFFIFGRFGERPSGLPE